jgi:YidC/Oxa1 family membrane protein insertase
MENDQKRAFMAVVLSGIILFGWQYFFAPKKVQTQAPTNVITRTNVDNTSSSAINNTNVVNEIKEVKTVNQNLESFKIFNETVSLSINNELEILDLNNHNEIFTYRSTVGDESRTQFLFNFNNKYEKVFFTFQKISDSEYSITSDNGLNGRIFINDKNIFKVKLGGAALKSVKVEINSTEKEGINGHARAFIYLTDELEQITVGDEETESKKARWFGIDLKHHAYFIGLSKMVNTTINSTEFGKFTAKFNVEEDLELEILYTKKKYDFLKTLGNNYHLSVDYGMFSVVAEPILWLLQKFYNFIPNYGIAIILLTLLVRFATFPLQYKSFASMKKMQIIQPELTKLREKFKDDPQKMQKESMALFKKAGANPLGGCLPMIAQMPIFLAMWRVLDGSVELLGSPFYFWITDLSVKDQYYVLPLLMCAAMFFQQKLMPSTSADPTQKKIMMFMPLIFGLIMKDLPAGLCLYMLVSTSLAILQQLFVFKRTT